MTKYLVSDAGANLPPQLATSEQGSFAEKTIVERKPQIIAQVIANNAYPETIVQALRAFEVEIKSQTIAPLFEVNDPLVAKDVTFWNSYWVHVKDRTWRDLPWYFAETWFYRRLLQDVRYFQQESPWYLRDPFAVSKREQERKALYQLDAVWDGILAIPVEQRFEVLLYSALWGNRADLSNFTVEENAQPGLSASQEQHNLLIDHTNKVKTLALNAKHVAFVNDNVGADSLFDVLLADYLLSMGVAQVTMHLKGQPFFVSDAMPQDIIHVIGALTGHANVNLQAVGKRLLAAVDAGTLALAADPFWTSCLCYDQLPDALAETVTQADLTILKGDVNYRRLLADRHWPHTTRMEDVVTFPRPFVALRTLKGEIMVGLERGVDRRIEVQEPDWLINGKRGVIQLVQDQTQSMSPELNQ